MKDNLTYLICILDRSGSMASCKEDAEKGFNYFLDEQRKVEGECRVSIVQFNIGFDEVCFYQPIESVESYTLTPGGMTALLDAIGKTVTKCGSHLGSVPEEERPSSVICVIVTDGQENSSAEWSKEAVRQLIETQQNQWNWQFVFLGANQDSFFEAGALGIAAHSTMDYDSDNTEVAYVALASAVTDTRQSGARLNFTPEQRKQAKPKK